MTTKIGIDGTPFDPAEKARAGIETLRTFFDRQKGNLMDAEFILYTRALNAIADRLQTCDAVEEKLRRERAAHVALISAAERLCSGFWTGLDKCDELVENLENALTGVTKK